MLAAINEIKESWAQATFDDSFADAKTQSNDLQTYKSTLKREWVTEKRELDTLLGNIQTKLSTYNLCNYVPPEGLSVEAVDQEWSGLLESEGRRRKAINEKLQNIKENLRRKYSDLANKFESDLNALSLELGSLSGDLDVSITQP